MRETLRARRLFAGLVLLTTAIAASRLWIILRVDGVTVLELGLMAIFVVLFAWISATFWLVCIGAIAKLRGWPGPLPTPRRSEAARPDTRTAIVMPVYNEPAARLFAGIRAMSESLSATGQADRFDFYVLSDSTEPACWAAEQTEWLHLRRSLHARIFYRRRGANIGRKSGNIADFCKNWGALYDYMVVLDADSLMTGEAILALAQLMDAHPRAALIQTLPMLIGRGSLFGAVQQFASRVYGPVFAAGLALLQGSHGNYWGHNAIIRVRAFVDHCGLPDLPGRAPLGGEILSHDFVEAALLSKAGWELWLAPDLGGSFEEAPGLVDHMSRDRRWCQGNLQHIRLLFARGLRLESRLHMVLGVMSYLSSPLWLLLLVLSAAETRAGAHLKPIFYDGRYPVLNLPVPHSADVAALVATTLALLFGPKLIAFGLLLRDRAALREMGGARMAAAGIAAESLFSTLYAPIAMLSQSGFVLSVLAGRSTPWTPPRRGQDVAAPGAAARLYVPHMLLALIAGAAAYVWIPGGFWWLTPLLAGPAVSVLLAEIMSRPDVARRAWRFGLFTTRRDDLAIVGRVDHILAGRDHPGARDGNHEPLALAS